MALTSKYQGVFTALITPFRKQEVDYTSLKKLIRFQLDHGIQGFVVNGTTAESPTLSSEEQKQIFKFVKTEVGGEVPLIMGTGTASTAQTCDNSKIAESLGAEAVLVVTPYYNRPPQRGLLKHYKAVVDSTQLPVILYNVPGRTGVALTAETVRELSLVENIIGIKDASGDIPFGQKLMHQCGEGFLVTSGDDITFVDLMCAGGKGVISVLSHVIPSETRMLSDRALSGDKSAATEFLKYKELAQGLFVEANPIPVKAALKEMGIIESEELRLPLDAMESELRVELIEKLKKVGCI